MIVQQTGTKGKFEVDTAAYKESSFKIVICSV